jgi:UDP-hydrolysing UDP-N-acetyl-D-glucosamine 2-epimerase
MLWLIREIASDPRLELRIIATGSHLSPEFGLTYRAIEADGNTIDRKVEVLISSDTAVGMSKAVGLGVIGFADALADLQPHLVVVLGDRFEIFAAAQAAFLARIPIAHISGGEITEGALDDGIRHCITKLSLFHFAAAEAYRQRIIQLGESPERVFNVGDPGLDSVSRLPLMSRDELTRALGVDPSKPYLLATYHPVTAGDADSLSGLRALFEALDAFPNYSVIFTLPNADAGSRVMGEMIGEYAASRPRVSVHASLGQVRYFSAMKYCAAVIGNSSSGIVEAPAMGRPTVNIGPRQQGRLKATSIIDCAATVHGIQSALAQALSESFAALASRAESLYGNCSASRQICDLLASVPLSHEFTKEFHDLH